MQVMELIIYVTSVLIGYSFYTTILLRREIKETQELKRENEQLKSHNRSLAKSKQDFLQGLLKGEGRIGLIDVAKMEVKQPQPVKTQTENYYDGIVEPQQYLDMELEWNKKSENK